jgi:hypothetical protein
MLQSYYCYNIYVFLAVTIVLRNVTVTRFFLATVTLYLLYFQSFSKKCNSCNSKKTSCTEILKIQKSSRSCAGSGFFTFLLCLHTVLYCYNWLKIKDVTLE